jgi:hypothetical protein
VNVQSVTEEPSAGVDDVPAAGTRASWLPLVLIVSLFFLWGGANNLNDVLIAQFKKAFVLSDFGAGLVQSAFYLGYFLVAMPAGMYMRRFGYKSAVVFGLALYGLGALLFWPAASMEAYGLFLFALFVIASGLAFLETSANPFVTLLGPRETATRRLNLAQAFNPLGSIAGILIGQHFIFTGVERSPAQIAAMGAAERTAYFASETHAVQWPYLVIGLVVLAWALLIVATRFPNLAVAKDPVTKGEGVLPTVRPSFYRRHVCPIFLCGRAGGRVELHHSLRAGEYARHVRKGSGQLPDRRAAVLHGRSLRRGGIDEIPGTSSTLGGFRRYQHRADALRRFASRQQWSLCAGDMQFLYVGDVSDHLRAWRRRAW